MTNNEKIEEIVEQLADIEHQRWADWQKYVHSKLETSENKNYLRLENTWIERWEKQISTPYNELTEKEKESDREQVRRYWHIIEQLITSSQAPLLKEIEELKEKLEIRFDRQDLKPFVQEMINDWINENRNIPEIVDLLVLWVEEKSTEQNFQLQTELAKAKKEIELNADALFGMAEEIKTLRTTLELYEKDDRQSILESLYEENKTLKAEKDKVVREILEDLLLWFLNIYPLYGVDFKDKIKDLQQKYLPKEGE